MLNYINKNNLTSLTMLGIIRVSSKGQIVIPESIREQLNLVEGSTCLVRTEDNKIILEKTEDVEKKLKLLEKQQEKLAWSKLAEKSLHNVWNNKEDEKEWKKYL